MKIVTEAPVTTRKPSLRTEQKSLQWTFETTQETRVWSRELESPRVRVLARSRCLSFEGDSDSGTYMSNVDFCVILWDLFYN